MKVIRGIKRQDKHMNKALLQGIRYTSKIRTFIIPEMLYHILFFFPDIHIYIAKVLKFNSQ